MQEGTQAMTAIASSNGAKRDAVATSTCTGCGIQVTAHMIACPDCKKPVGYSGGTPLTSHRYLQMDVSEQKSVAISKDTPIQQEALTMSIQGHRLLQSKNYEEAIVALTEAVNLDPSFIGAYRGRAEAYQKVSRVEEAKADLQFMASKTPTINRQITPNEYSLGNRRMENSSEDVVGTGRYVLRASNKTIIGTESESR